MHTAAPGSARLYPRKRPQRPTVHEAHDPFRRLRLRGNAHTRRATRLRHRSVRSSVPCSALHLEIDEVFGTQQSDIVIDPLGVRGSRRRLHLGVLFRGVTLLLLDGNLRVVLVIARRAHARRTWVPSDSPGVTSSIRLFTGPERYPNESAHGLRKGRNLRWVPMPRGQVLVHRGCGRSPAPEPFLSPTSAGRQPRVPGCLGSDVTGSAYELVDRQRRPSIP